VIENYTSGAIDIWSDTLHEASTTEAFLFTEHSNIGIPFYYELGVKEGIYPEM